MSRGNAKLVQYGFYGRLEASLEAQRDVVRRLLGEVFGARLVAEAAPAIVMTARNICTDVDVNQGHRRLT